MHVLVFGTTCKIYMPALSNIMSCIKLVFSGCILQVFVRSSKQSLYLVGLSGLTELSDVFKGFKGFWTFYLL